jgi:deazaflavin-dependent oxidoreductase (nitroreductase family)
MNTTVRYVRAGLVAGIVNSAVRWVTARGVSIWGSQVLAVRGRRSGEWRTVVLNPLDHEGARYLVAPRGHAEWVRNLRAAGGAGELRLGKRAKAFVADELADADKPEVLRAYLRRWKFEVGAFFEGVDETASDEILLAIAPGYPVFRMR